MSVLRPGETQTVKKSSSSYSKVDDRGPSEALARPRDRRLVGARARWAHVGALSTAV